ncbi:MAG: hypothetical protein KC416_12975, partial [Myxococcales bacterium]|nr:hypothetical protein [Myxococcales bacterium]
NSAPVFRVDRGELAMTGGAVLDNPGKAFGTEGAVISLRGTLISRCDSGGEFKHTRLTMEETHTLEMPDADGVANDDDNDGVYLSNAYGPDGKEEYSILRNVVFAVGEDDAIDHNGGLVRVDGAWIRGFLHEGVAASNSRRIEIRDAIISKCEQGLEAGYGSPTVIAERVYVVDNNVGLRIGDSYDRLVSGTLTVRDSVIARNGENLRNYSNRDQGPIAGALTVSCSWVGDPAGPTEGTCNRLEQAPTNTCPSPSDEGSGCECGLPAPRTCDRP